MQKKWKKVMAGTLSVCLLTACVPEISGVGSYTQTSEVVHVQAATNTKKTSGTCGTKATWKYNSTTKTLTISGSGAMTRYAVYEDDDGEKVSVDKRPWAAYRDEIKKVVVGNKITEIGINAFCRCTELEKITLGSKLKKINSSAFYGCKKLKSINNGKGFGGELTKIYAEAFGECDSLEKVDLGNKLKQINDSAFYGCDKLKSIKIGKSLKSIGSSVFAGCVNLEKIEVNAKNKYFMMKGNSLLNKEGTQWLCGCFTTDTVCRINEKVVGIEEEVIINNPNIEKIKVSSKNKTFSSEDGLLYSKDGKELYLCPPGKKGTVTVQKKTTQIGNGQYESYLFKNCANLEKIVIGKNVKKMLFNLEGCTKLKEIEIATGNQVYASEKGSILSADGKELLFCVATDNGTYKVPDGVETVHESAFARKFDEEELNRRGSVISIEHLILPDSMEEFSCYDEDYYTVWNRFEGLKSITLGEKYHDGGSLPWLTGHVEQADLEAVYVSEKNAYYSSVDGVLYDKEQTKLLLCPAKNKICKMPDTVISIAERAFYKDKEVNDLEQLYISDKIKDMTGEKWVFGDKLKLLHLGMRVNNLDVNMEAKGLEQITVSPENQTYKAEDYVLYTKDGSKLLYCPKGRSGEVSVCSGTSIIGASSFSLCKNVTEITLPDSVTKVEKNAFNDVAENVVFKVPAGKKEFFEKLLTEDTGFGKNMTIKEIQ